MNKKIFITYDIETFRSIFCVVFKYEDRYLSFEISERKNQTKDLVSFIKKGIKSSWFFVGFNNVRFDAQVIQWILDQKRIDITSEEIHEFTQEVIEKANSRQFPPYAEHHLKFKQIDLFLINHYNNSARSTSLKWLEYSMNWKKVQDLPYKHDDVLTIDTFDSIIKYCKNDVDATHEFFTKCDEILDLRFNQQKENPDLNLLNKSDSSVGEILFLDLMSEKLNIKKSKLKKTQTHRSKIHLKDVILPQITFRTETFKSVLDYFKSITITSEESSFKYKVEYNGIDYVYGVGGLHASVSNKIIEAKEGYSLVDADVASYYPNLAIKNKFYPKHLSDSFCELYEELYIRRKSIPKGNSQNKSLKLLLNSIYGKSGDIYSFIYDKFFQMCITVNGQLLLTMLAENLSLIEGVSIFYVNTDGLTMEVRNDKKKEVYELCKKWENFTQLELEYAVYKKMAIRDVNNFLAIDKNDKIKLKGAFEIDVDYHKNRSQRIVPIAVKRYLIDNISIEETIKQHLVYKKDYGNIENQGIFDFCIGKKIKSNQTYVLEKKLNRVLPNHETKEEKQEFLERNNWEEVERNGWRPKWTDLKLRGFTDAYRTLLLEVYPEYQSVKKINDKVIRFYVSENGLRLNKNYSDGRREITVGGNKVKLFMDYEEKEDYEINYQYYIDEAYKIIHDLDGTNERIAKEEALKREQERQRKEQERQKLIKEKEESMFLKYCNTENGPTKKQYEKYGKDWLIEKYGKPMKIR